MKTIILSFFFLSFLYSSSQIKTNSEFDSEKETEIFMEQWTKDFEFKPNVTESSNKIDLLECFDELKRNEDLFTLKELKYLKVKLGNDSLKKWSKKLLPNVELISNETINSKGKFKFIEESKKNLYTFSHPIFLRNGKYCIFYEEYKCSWSCGGGTLYIFEKKGQNWKIIKRYCEWIN